MKKEKVDCPLCHQPLSGELETILRERQSIAGHNRWKGIRKRDRSKIMRAVRLGEKKVALAA